MKIFYRITLVSLLWYISLPGCKPKIDNLPGTVTNVETEPKTEKPEIAIVTIDELRYRNGPNLNSEVGGRLPKNTVIELTGAKSIATDSIPINGTKTLDYWYEFQRDGSNYWIYGGGIKFIDKFEELPDSTLISPGLFVGIVSKDDTELTLNKKFGSDKVDRVNINMGEGITAEGNVIYPGTPKELFVIWKENNFTNIFAVEITNKNTVYATSEGLTIGTGIDDVQKMNKKPFTILGFSSDLSGKLNSWENGHFTKDLLVYFKTSTDEYASEVKTDNVLSSDDYKFQYAKPIVSKIRVYFGE